MCFVRDGNVKTVGKYLRETRTWQYILRRRDVLEEKQKSFVPAVNSSISSEKVFYGGGTKFSYTACQWIEAQAIETGKHIHHKICGHGGERMVTVLVLNDKGGKEPASFLVDGYEPETNTIY